jgi:hypothetical protein
MIKIYDTIVLQLSLIFDPFLFTLSISPEHKLYCSREKETFEASVTTPPFDSK